MANCQKCSQEREHICEARRGEPELSYMAPEDTPSKTPDGQGYPTCGDVPPTIEESQLRHICAFKPAFVVLGELRRPRRVHLDRKRLRWLGDYQHASNAPLKGMALDIFVKDVYRVQNSPRCHGAQHFRGSR